MSDKMKRIHDQSGMLVVEATMVFPVMFLVIFLMIFAGNAYLQKCRIEAIANEMAINGASYCVDPLLDDIENGSMPDLSAKVRPYRYFLGGMNEIEDEITSRFNDRIKKLSSGLFSNMKPKSVNVNVIYNNYFIYSTFAVDVSYRIEIPVRLLGDTEYISFNIASRTNMPVADTTEFIRNVGMVEDYMESLGITETINKKIEEISNTVKKWFKK